MGRQLDDVLGSAAGGSASAPRAVVGSRRVRRPTAGRRSDAAAAAPPRADGSLLARFALISAPLLLANMGRLALDVPVTGVLSAAWLLVAELVYATMALAIVFVPLLAVDRLLRLLPDVVAMGRRRVVLRRSLVLVALLAVTALQLLAHVDVVVHHMYGFHLNGFVWNLVTTSGGLESLGADAATTITVSAIAAGLLAIEALLLLVAARCQPFIRWVRPLGRPRAVFASLALLALLVLGEKGAYGMADVRDERTILLASSTVPFYARTNIRNFAESMGWLAERDEQHRFDVDLSALSYPRAPLQRAPGSRDWNIVWLVAESLRADAVDPEIMPATWAFAAGASDFRRHYSGGNGTRMGVFSMFYGLYGAYWFPFLAERRGPVLIDTLIGAGYDITARTSARFSYPEFDTTVWSRVPAEQLLERDPDLLGWENDRKHVTDLLADLDARDTDRPFLQFLFFESAHSRYTFPEESVIRRPYLESMNYATLDPECDAQLLINRYHNSCHHLDQQLGRVLDGLQTRGLLASTIVVITGDHGEEFMEKGRWGHHATFSEESTRVPLILHVPGQAPRSETRLTSHLDIVPTLLSLLGVTNPASDYSLGLDLLGGAQRDYAVVADWDRLAIVDDVGKGVLPVRGGNMLDSYATDLDDQPLPDPGAWFERAAPRVGEVALGMARFVR